MEFDKELVERSLKAWNFDIEHLSIEAIQHVPMHEWRISTQDKPLLYVENLQCCVGLYAYGNNFAFAAHINTIVFDKNEYELDENRKPLYCNRCQDLLKQIVNYNGNITEPFKIGIAFGVTPLDDTEKPIILIYEGVEKLMKELNYSGIPAIQLENIDDPEFIVDTLNNCIVVPKQKKISK